MYSLDHQSFIFQPFLNLLNKTGDCWGSLWFNLILVVPTVCSFSFRYRTICICHHCCWVVSRDKTRMVTRTTFLSGKQRLHTITVCPYQNLTSQPLFLNPQIREQMSGPDLHVFTNTFLALKKLVFPPIKNTFQIFFDFCLPLFYATF